MGHNIVRAVKRKRSRETGKAKQITESAGKRARRLQPEARKDHLLACAMRVFGRRGVAGARHLDVAREAGVSLSTVFLYFPTRDALRRAVVEELERWAVSLARSVHRRAAPADTALYQHLVRFADLLDERPEYAGVWFGWSMAVDDPLWGIYLRLQGKIERVITATVRRGQREGRIAPELSPEDVALIVIGAAYVIAQAKAAGRPRPKLERLVRTLVDSLRRAVANERGERPRSSRQRSSRTPTAIIG